MALAWSVGAGALLQLLLELARRARPEARSDVVTVGAVEAAAFLLLGVGVLRLHAPDRPARAVFALRPTQPALGAFGLALGLTLQVPAESLRQLVQARFPLPDEALAQRAALLAAGTPLRVALLVAVLGLAVPLVEELFFRGALFGALRRGMAPLAAAVVTAVGFALSHLEPRGWPALVLVGAVLGYLRAASGSMLPSLALHVGFNSVSLGAMLSGVVSVTRPPVLGPGLLLGGWAASAALVVAVHRVAQYSPEAARARAEDD
jgi:hypothetical protein